MIKCQFQSPLGGIQGPRKFELLRGFVLGRALKQNAHSSFGECAFQHLRSLATKRLAGGKCCFHRLIAIISGTRPSMDFRIYI